MSHTIRDKKPLLTRVRKIKGQVQALENLLENGADCASVLQQIAAVRGAVGGLMANVLEGHVREHAGAPDITPEERSVAVDQVVTALRSYLK